MIGAYDDGKGNASDAINGHCVIGKFTADSTTVEIAITGVAGTNGAHLNAYQILKLSVQ